MGYVHCHVPEVHFLCRKSRGLCKSVLLTRQLEEPKSLKKTESRFNLSLLVIAYGMQWQERPSLALVKKLGDVRTMSWSAEGLSASQAEIRKTEKGN